MQAMMLAIARQRIELLSNMIVYVRFGEHSRRLRLSRASCMVAVASAEFATSRSAILRRSPKGRMSSATRRTGFSPSLWVPTLYFAEGLPFYAVNMMALIFYSRMGVRQRDDHGDGEPARVCHGR